MGARMITTIRCPIVKQCPYYRETDRGELTITFQGPAPELHELAGDVDEIAREPISHEQFTAAVAALVPGAEVVTRWETVPWQVQVTEILRQPFYSDDQGRDDSRAPRDDHYS